MLGTVDKEIKLKILRLMEEDNILSKCFKNINLGNTERS